MNFKTLITELEDIPITTHKATPKADSLERIEPRKQEVDKGSESGFTLSNFQLKKGKLSASTEEELDKKVDRLLTQTANRMSMVYNYGEDGHSHYAYIVYYDKDVSKFDGKYKIALKNKIESFAKDKTKDTAKPKIDSKKTFNNIQQTLARLSDKSLKDVHEYAKALARRDNNDYTQ
jgi:hypothetical protein